MRDVLCVGIGCLDVLVRGADMALPFQGEAKKCECVALEIGGDAINQAVALRRLGVDAGLVTGLGTDEAGELILSQLAAEACLRRVLFSRPAVPASTSS